MKRIYRVEKNKNYSVINNNIFIDNRISWGAKGVLAYALTKPDDWNLNVQDVVNRGKGGRSQVSSYFKELRKIGYLEYNRIYENGKVARAEYTIYENPLQRGENLKSENLLLENLNLEKRSLLNTDNILNTEKEVNTIDPIPKIQETSFFGEDQSIKFVQSLKSILKTYKPKFQRIESQSVRLLIAEGIQLDEITKTMQKFESLRAKDDFLAKIPFSIQTLVGKNNDFRMYNYVLDMPENTLQSTDTNKNHVSNGKIATTSNYGVYGGLKPIPEPDPNDY